MNTDKTAKTVSAPENAQVEWRHPITGETREEMHAKRTKYTPQIGPNYCPNCGRKLTDCEGNCVFSTDIDLRKHGTDAEASIPRLNP